MKALSGCFRVFGSRREGVTRLLIPRSSQNDGATSQTSLLERLFDLKDSSSLNFVVLFVYVLILNREGLFVPSPTEAQYLPHLAKQWNPDFLANDWTFAALPSHFVFSNLFGPLTLLFPLEIVGWMGRFLSWSLILIGLFQLGKQFRIPRWMITISIFFWLLHEQSIVAGEYILATFEAKSLAYALLLFSLNGFMQSGIVVPSILLGLTFSFHPLVGLWATLAVGLCLVFLRYPIQAIIKFGCYTTLFALPGLIPLLVTPFQSGPKVTETLRFLSLVVMPYHFDPFFFGKLWQPLLLLTLLLCFNGLHFKLGAKNDALRFLVSFQFFLALFFILGFVARYAENYKLLLLMPCRLFPVLLPLFFFLHFMNAVSRFHSMRYGTGLIVLGLCVFASFANPVDEFIYRAGKNYLTWTRREEDVQKAFRWIAINTPGHSIVVSPPWRSDSFYLSRRAQIAAWSVPRFDRLAEWRERLESLVGDVSGLTGYGTTETQRAFMASHYNALRSSDITLLMEKYGAEYLVSSTTYNYPVVFQSGSFKVYFLKKTARLEHPVEAFGPT